MTGKPLEPELESVAPLAVASFPASGSKAGLSRLREANPKGLALTGTPLPLHRRRDGE
jgi:hypothetical protein